MDTIDQTHNPLRRSWVDSANTAGCPFPIQNLPYGVFRRRRTGESWRGGVAIGDQILDLRALDASPWLTGIAAEALAAAARPVLNDFMALGRRHWVSLRAELSRLLCADSVSLGPVRASLQSMLVPQAEAEMRLPANVGDYSDFFTSYHHAVNSGRINRPHQVLSASFKHMPIGYHGRASTVVISGTPVRRPLVQTREGNETVPTFGPCRMLDYEAELGFHVGPGNALGDPIPIKRIQEHLFGCTLLNDWSARDAQTWEKFGSGPLLAKDFATSISPWIVTMEALAPFRLPAPVRSDTDPAPLPYLDSPFERSGGAIDIVIAVSLLTEQMRHRGEAPFDLSCAHFSEQYFTIGQITTHHASNGCALRPGDIIGSGTVSNESPESWGCLMERTQRGRVPLALPQGDARGFLVDGDELILSAHCQRDGFIPIGFGQCRGRILPAPAIPIE